MRDVNTKQKFEKTGEVERNTSEPAVGTVRETHFPMGSFNKLGKKTGKERKEKKRERI